MRKHLVQTLLLLPLAACMTTAKDGGRRDPSLAPQEDKAGSKEGPAAPPTATPEQAAATAPPPAPRQIEAAPAPSVDEQLQFVRKQASPSAPFTDAEHLFVAQLPSSPAAGSVGEAALAIGLVKTVLFPMNGETSTFQEADLAKQPGDTPPPAEKPKSKVLSLEQLCKERGLNLPDALTENPLLGSAGVAKQVMAALAVSENSLDFTNEITVALKKQAGAWNEVSGAPGMQTAPAATPPPAQPAAPAAVAQPKPEDLLPPSPAELSGGENVLSEAQALADRGNYQAAIKMAGSVPDGSPLKPQAQEKVKDYSNLAVQDLRRRAAQAFQTAMPVSDPRTRAGYLRQAKDYLEEAIKDFPDASQLPTVRDNLRVISRDLEKLEAESGGGEKKGE